MFELKDIKNNTFKEEDANIHEQCHEKTGFLPMRKQTEISFAVRAKLISAFVFATQIAQSLFYLYPKF